MRLKQKLLEQFTCGSTEKPQWQGLSCAHMLDVLLMKTLSARE